jgi:hypothetical protein
MAVIRLSKRKRQQKAKIKKKRALTAPEPSMHRQFPYRLEYDLRLQAGRVDTCCKAVIPSSPVQAQEFRGCAVLRS